MQAPWNPPKGKVSYDVSLIKDISVIIPNFYEELDAVDTDSLPLPPLSDDDEDYEAQYPDFNGLDEHSFLQPGQYQTPPTNTWKTRDNSDYLFITQDKSKDCL